MLPPGALICFLQTVIGSDRAVAMSLSQPPLGSRNVSTLNNATTTVIMYAASRCYLPAAAQHNNCLHIIDCAIYPFIDVSRSRRALTGCPDIKMKDAIEGLSPPQQSLLMQYIYRGMAQRNEARILFRAAAERCTCSP
jgi:hypothetical protein